MMIEKKNGHSFLSWETFPIFFSGLFLLLLGIIVMGGWWSGSRFIVQIDETLPPMRFSTALGFFLSGWTLLLLAARQFSWAYATSILLFFLALISLLNTLFPHSWQIESQLFRPWVSLHDLPPYPAALGAAFSFLLASTVFFWVAMQKRHVLLYLWMSACGTMILIAVIFGFIQYILHRSLIDPILDTPGLALHTTAGLIILGLSFAYYSYLVVLKIFSPFLERWILAQAILMALVLNISVWLYLRQNEQENLMFRLEGNAKIIKNIFSYILKRNYSSLQRTASLIEQKAGYQETAWRIEAEEYLYTQPGMRRIQLINPSKEVDWVVEKDQSDAFVEAWVPAMKNNPYVIERFDQELYLIFSVPYEVENESKGSLSIFYNLTFMIHEVERLLLFSDESYSLMVGTEPIYVSPLCLPEGGANVGRASFIFLGTTWSIVTCLGKMTELYYVSFVPFFILLTLVLCSVLIIFLLHYLYLSFSQRKKLAEAKKTASTFLAGVSHEIRTPLQGIIGSSSLLEATELSSKQERLVQIITNSGQILSDLINDILDLSKIESGLYSFQEEAVPIREFFESILALFEDRFAKKGLRLSFITSLSYKDKVQIAPRQVRQMMINMIGNALKFTKEGLVEVAVDKQPFALGPSSALRIRVSDTGIGIPKEKIPHIFERFFQVESSHVAEVSGTGLGLTICEMIVKRLGGTIQVESEVGKGTSFLVLLPIHEEGLR